MKYTAAKETYIRFMKASGKTACTIDSYGMDLFQRQGDVWNRSFEEHQEYAYSRQQLTEFLRRAGFTAIACYGDRKLSEPEQGEQRMYFKARKGKIL